MNSYIKGISYYLPEEILTNNDLINDFPEWHVDKIADKVGIIQRHIAKSDETSGDMAEKAALRLFNEYNIDPAKIDYILLNTQSPDYFLPTTACILQHKLNIPTTAGALDINLGCSGYVYGLSIAKGLISGGIAQNILLLTAETYSKFLHPKDKSNRTIFGDAATATLISTEGIGKIKNFSLGSDGSGYQNLIVETGGLRNRRMLKKEKMDENGSIISSDHLYMNGSEIFNFTLDTVPKLIENTLAKNNLTLGDIDLFVFHQANKFMLNSLRKLCGIDKERFLYCLDRFGNTVSSTIPIALKEAITDKIIKESQKILLAGFGVGYSWGGCIVKF